MVASEFEYRHRFWMIVFVYIAAYSFYNLDHLNILYAVVSSAIDGVPCFSSVARGFCFPFPMGPIATIY